MFERRVGGVPGHVRLSNTTVRELNVFCEDQDTARSWQDYSSSVAARFVVTV